MNRKTKIVLIVIGAILIAGALGVVIYGLTKKDDTDSETDENLPEGQNINPESISGSGFSGGQGSGNGATSSWGGNLIEPVFDVEGQLSNSFHQLKDRTLYPKRESIGGWGYSNIRSSPEVNNNTSWWTDGIDNLITTISSGTPIGKVLSVETHVYNEFPYKWFKVKLNKAVGGWFTPYTEGYVRADTVTIKPYSP